MKRFIQRQIRSVHETLFSRDLPDAVAVYMHALERRHHGSFEAFVAGFRERGYRFCGPDEFVSGSGLRVYLSFDDNYRSWYEALELLASLGVAATFYVNTQPLRDVADGALVEAYFDRVDHHGDRVALSSEELEAIHAAGHTIGNHTHSHAVLTGLDHGQAVEEIERCTQALAALLDERAVHFSFPFGMRRHFDDALFRYARDAGFETVASAIPGLQFAPPEPGWIHRTLWDLDAAFEVNLATLRIDGRLFERLTGRSAVG